MACRKKARFSFLLPFNRSLFHVWKLKTRVFQCGAWMCMCPLAHLFLISWLESISHQKKQKNNFFLTRCSEAFALQKAFLSFAILVPLVGHYKMQSTLCMGCSAYSVLGSFPSCCGYFKHWNLLEKSLCWEKKIERKKKHNNLIHYFLHEAQIKNQSLQQVYICITYELAGALVTVWYKRLAMLL